MNDFFKKIKDIYTDSNLDIERKAELRERLEYFMDLPPDVREAEFGRRNIYNSTKSYFFNINQNKKIMPIAAALAVLLLIGGGGSVAAEGALPGDALYPVKINVNEKVRGAFAFSTEAEAEWSARRAERRLEEAGQLATEGRLSADARMRIEENFEAHAERVETKIAELESKGSISQALNVATRLETSLRVHEDILERLSAPREQSNDDDSEEDGEPEGEAESARITTRERAELSSKVEQRRQTISGIRARLEGNVPVSHGDETSLGTSDSIGIRVAAEARIRNAERTIMTIRNRLSNLSSLIDSETVADAEARISASESILAEARAEFEAENYGRAFALANDAWSITHEVNILLRAHGQGVFTGDVQVFPGTDNVSIDDHQSGAVSYDIETGIITVSPITGPGSSVDPGKEMSVPGSAGEEPPEIFLESEAETEAEAESSNQEVEAEGKVEVKVGL